MESKQTQVDADLSAAWEEENWDRKRTADCYQTDGKGIAKIQIRRFILLTSYCYPCPIILRSLSGDHSQAENFLKYSNKFVCFYYSFEEGGDVTEVEEGGEVTEVEEGGEVTEATEVGASSGSDLGRQVDLTSSTRTKNPVCYE